MRRYAAMMFAACLLGGCTSKTLEIESNTSWSGAIGGSASRSVQGSGNHSYSINDGETFCWTMQKETRTGTLRAYAKIHGTITGIDREDDATTTADFGLVSGCTH